MIYPKNVNDSLVHRILFMRMEFESLLSVCRALLRTFVRRSLIFSPYRSLLYSFVHGAITIF